MMNPLDSFFFKNKMNCFFAFTCGDFMALSTSSSGSYANLLDTDYSGLPLIRSIYCTRNMTLRGAVF